MDMQEEYNLIPNSKLVVPFQITNMFTLWDFIYAGLSITLDAIIIFDISQLYIVLRLIIFALILVLLALGFIRRNNSTQRYYQFILVYVIPFSITKKRYKKILWKWKLINNDKDINDKKNYIILQKD